MGEFPCYVSLSSNAAGRCALDDMLARQRHNNSFSQCQYLTSSTICANGTLQFTNSLTFDVKIRNRACGGVISALGKAGGPLVCWSVVENACISPDDSLR